VRIDVEVKPVVIAKTFHKVPVKIRGVDNNQAEVDPAVVSVRLSGPRHLLRSMDRDAISVGVDAQHPSADGKSSIVPTVDLPPGINLISITPSEVKIAVKQR
jgi:hypothetical protein